MRHVLFCTGWGGHLFRRFCNIFLRVPLVCLGSMAAALQPGELSGNSLLNLRNKWTPHPVFCIVNCNSSTRLISDNELTTAATVLLLILHRRREVLLVPPPLHLRPRHLGGHLGPRGHVAARQEQRRPRRRPRGDHSLLASQGQVRRVACMA